MMPATYLF